ncbi:nitroreductase/quinone reductase family protein [Yinghuangia seranimata]|uniref:nitroreductase/quinone reductase family protein n=1 Tax=Yinghuangia seranimata TaxID=408067 RepID=UPI00248C080D|nr:nitroreductase/quinone reductase family protein [Yinghuangia seranimata]MDI2130461.1 nitroreductase/quinone reductase family protein [Yinghuangia seranimata]
MGLYTRGLRKLGHYRWMARLGPHLVRADRRLQQRTKGRVSLMGRDFHPLLLTSTGRRSGLPRVSPLIYAPVEGGFALAGTNFGQRHHPAWTANLIAEPAAVVSVDGRETSVRARLITEDGPERELVWGALLKVWPAYDTYAARAGRPIRVFLLTPDAAGPAADAAPTAEPED